MQENKQIEQEGGVTRTTHISYITILQLSKQLKLKSSPLIKITFSFSVKTNKDKQNKILVIILVTRQIVHYIGWYCENLFTNTGLIILLRQVNEFCPFSHFVFFTFIGSPMYKWCEYDCHLYHKYHYLRLSSENYVSK